MRPTLLGAHFAARLAITYKFLCLFLPIIMFANGIKIVLLHCTAIVRMRHYGGALISGRLCLAVKITKSSGVLISISSEFDGYGGIGKET